MRRTMTKSIFLALGLLTFAGCNAYRMKPPQGFAEVDASRRGAHYKAGDDAGLSVKVYPNVRGGTLAFWSEDLVNKLGERGYELVDQQPVKSKNGRSGTQFQFRYDTPDGQHKFYSAALFVTDKHRVVMQLAGDEELTGKYQPQVPKIASSMKVRGCRAWTDICDGAQPGHLQTKPKQQEPDTTENLASDDAPDESPGGAG
jgi:hypothetical protein